MRINIGLAVAGIVLLAAGISLGMSPRTPSRVLAQGQAAAQIPCGTYYLPGASHDPMPTEWSASGPPIAVREQACKVKNPTAWTVLTWLATVAGGVLFAVGVVLAAVGAARRGRVGRDAVT